MQAEVGKPQAHQVQNKNNNNTKLSECTTPALGGAKPQAWGGINVKK